MITAWWLLLGALSLSSSCQALAPPLTLALDAIRAETSRGADEIYIRGPAFKYPLELAQPGMSKGFIMSPSALEQGDTKNVHGPGDSNKHQRNLLLRFGRSCDQLALRKGCRNKRSINSNSYLPLNEYQVPGTRWVSQEVQRSVRHSRYPRGSTRSSASGTGTFKNLRKPVPRTFMNERKTVPQTSKAIGKTDTRNFKTVGETGPESFKTPGIINAKTAGETNTRNYNFDSMLVGHVRGSRTNFPILGNGISLSKLGKRIGGISFSPKNGQNKDAFNTQSEKADHLNFIRFG